jgi:hypothetical protein
VQQQWTCCRGLPILASTKGILDALLDIGARTGMQENHHGILSFIRRESVIYAQLSLRPMGPLLVVVFLDVFKLITDFCVTNASDDERAPQRWERITVFVL